MTDQKKNYIPFSKRITFKSDSAVASIDVKFSDDGRLSISGEAREFGRYGSSSAGQCQDEMLKMFPESQRLYEIWQQWHLNDMRAACEHQRKNWDTTATITMYTYTLTSDGLAATSEVMRSAKRELLDGKTVKLTPSQIALAQLPYTVKNDQPKPPSMLYQLDTQEDKTAGWVSPSESSRGLLAKPCEVCGYKYGTKWLFEEVPTEILEELKAM